MKGTKGGDITSTTLDQTAFDRALSLVEMPDVLASKPSIVQAINALLGHSATFQVQTAKNEDGFTVFITIVDEQGLNRIVLPPKVTATISRQRQSLIDRSRRKPRPRLNREEREQQRIRDAKRILRQAKGK